MIEILTPLLFNIFHGISGILCHTAKHDRFRQAKSSLGRDDLSAAFPLCMQELPTAKIVCLSRHAGDYWLSRCGMYYMRIRDAHLDPERGGCRSTRY